MSPDVLATVVTPIVTPDPVKLETAATLFEIIRMTPPSVAVIMGALLFALALRYLGSFFKNDTRSANIDRANDDLLLNMQKEVARLTERVTNADMERARYFTTTLDLTTQIATLTERLRALEEHSTELIKENVRLEELVRLRSEEIHKLREQLQARPFPDRRTLPGGTSPDVSQDPSTPVPSDA